MHEILLICDYAPSDEHVGARRWCRFIPALEPFGFKFEIIAPQWDGTCTFTDAGYPTHRWKISSPKVCAWQFKKRRPLFLRPNSSMQSRPLNNIYVGFKKLTLRALNAYYFPDVSWYMARSAVDIGSKVIKNRKPSLIIATHPFCGSLRSAQILSKTFEIPWIADMRDGWSGYHLNLYRDSKSLTKRLRNIERETLDTADLIISATDGVNKGIVCSHSNKEVVYTGFNTFNSSNIKTNLDTGTLEVALAGSVTEMHDIATFLKGWQLFLNLRAPRSKLNYYGNYFPFLKQKAIECGIPDSSVVNKGFLKMEALMPSLKAADALIAIGMNGSNGAAYASARIFDYFAAARPILAASASQSELTRMVSLIPDCFYCKEPSQVCSALDQLLSIKAKCGMTYLNQDSLNAINAWSIEGQANQLANILQQHV